MIEPISWSGLLRGRSGAPARLTYYSPGLRHASHSHHVPHVSVLVAGSLRETTGSGDELICHGQVAFRADGARHSVCFGPAGALILTCQAGAWVGQGMPRSGVRWLGASPNFGSELVALVGRGAAQARIEGRLRKLSSISAISVADGAAPPDWLRSAAAQLLASPGSLPIAVLARRAGVHRVHFTRSFQRHFGMPPSLFRRRAMTARAIAAALSGRSSLALAAAEAGFADQSHMARAVREGCGMALRDLRALLGHEVTSIQSAGGKAH